MAPGLATRLPSWADYLARYGSAVRRWDQPEPDGDAPEAEWGFEPALGEDVERFAADHGYGVRRLAFHEPEDLSPLVADLHRWWYRRRGIEPARLVAGSFIVMEPWWTLRSASVPWWGKFGVESSVERLDDYLAASVDCP